MMLRYEIPLLWLGLKGWKVMPEPQKSALESGKRKDTVKAVQDLLGHCTLP
jgi:hypothetical protein